jgi:2-amino-4-hydroxy-6-hydroxymethyldihydropteridine diphosphokinase
MNSAGSNPSGLVRSFIAVGSNISPAYHIQKALELLIDRVRVVGVSTFYRTRAIDRPDQPDYLNGVFEIKTALRPEALKRDILAPIEKALDRVRTADRYAARTIDLDIALYGDETIDAPDLTIPDPDIRTRPFLAKALLELAPDLILPDTSEPLAEIVDKLGTRDLIPDEEATSALEKMVGDRGKS